MREDEGEDEYVDDYRKRKWRAAVVVGDSVATGR